MLAFVNQDLHVKRRADLENAHLEIIWLEVFPFKSKKVSVYFRNLPSAFILFG